MMADLGLALALILGGHEAGHQAVANNTHTPMEWNITDSGLRWQTPRTRDSVTAKINGAGFKSQDVLTRALQGTELEKPARTVSALNKLGYIIFPQSIGGNENTGDINNIDRAVGKNFGREILAITALMNLIKTKKDIPFDLSFDQTNKGTPMLMFNKRF